MQQHEKITYWITSSDRDYQAMIHLYEKKHYTWSLFIGHLVIEKLLKALYTQKFSNNPPYTHDLYRLSKRKRSRGFFLCVLCGLYGEKSSPPRRR
jgi:HEPN domain-containing protein